MLIKPIKYYNDHSPCFQSFLTLNHFRSTARTFYWRLQSILQKGKHSQPPVSLVGQLLWREFFYTCGATIDNFDKMKGGRFHRCFWTTTHPLNRFGTSCVSRLYWALILCFFLNNLAYQWGPIRLLSSRTQRSIRLQHNIRLPYLSQLKDRWFILLNFFYCLWKCNSLYLRPVLPASSWWPINLLHIFRTQPQLVHSQDGISRMPSLDLWLLRKSQFGESATCIKPFEGTRVKSLASRGIWTQVQSIVIPLPKVAPCITLQLLKQR